jgi:hypothetical protein
MKTIALALAFLVADFHVAIARPHHRLHVAQVAPAKREQLKQRVQALRTWTLITELQLDDATAARVAPILTRFDDQIGRQLQQGMSARRAVADAAAQGDERAINRAIDDALTSQRARAQLEEQRFQELRRVLTPVQAARLLDVLPAIDHRIHRQLRRVLEERRGRRGLPPGPRPPRDEEDAPPLHP